MRRWAPWAAGLALAGAGAAEGAPGTLELRVERATFGVAAGGPLGVEGAHMRLELPDPAASPLRLDVRSSLTGRTGGEAGWWRTVSGTVRLEGVGGRMPRSDLLRSVSLALLRRLPLAPEPGEPKAAARIPIEEASATFELAGGAARSEDLRVVTRDYVLKGACQLDADLALQLNGTLQLTPSGLDTVLSVAGLGLGLERAVHVPALPVRAAGTLSEPRFEADVSALPLAAWALVPRALGAARGAAKKGIERLTGAARDAGGVLGPHASEGEERR